MHVFHQNRKILLAIHGILQRNSKFLTDNQRGSRKSKVLICNINTPLPLLYSQIGKYKCIVELQYYVYIFIWWTFPVRLVYNIQTLITLKITEILTRIIINKIFIYNESDKPTQVRKHCVTLTKPVHTHMYIELSKYTGIMCKHVHSNLFNMNCSVGCYHLCFIWLLNGFCCHVWQLVTIISCRNMTVVLISHCLTIVLISHNALVKVCIVLSLLDSCACQQVPASSTHHHCRMCSLW